MRSFGVSSVGRLGIVLVILTACFAFGFRETPAQSQARCFRGVVKDSQDSVIAGAKVVLLNPSGKVLVTEFSDAEGSFSLPCHGKGVYKIQIFQTGMSPIEKKVEFGHESLKIADIILSSATLYEYVNVEITAEFVAVESETATKTPTALRDIPQSVDIVNRQLLDSRASLSLKSALENVTAVSAAQGEGRRDEFFIRGFSAMGDQFVDGVRDDAQYYRDLSNVEQIEVVKGPGAALFGRGSSGGIINRTTKRPNLYGAFGNIEGNFGGYGQKRGMLDLGRPLIDERLAIRFVGAYESGGSFRHFYEGKRFNIAPSIDWKITPRSDLVVQLEYLDDQRLPDRGIPSFRGRAFDIPKDTYFGYPKFDDVKNRVLSNSVRFERVLSKGWTLRNVFRRIGTATDYFNTYPNGVCLMQASGACATTFDSQISPDDERLRVIRGQYNGIARQTNYFNQTESLGFLKTWAIRHKLLFGTEFGHQTRANIVFRNSIADPVTFFNPILTPPVNNGVASSNNRFTGKTFGVYFQDQLDIAPKLKALVGFRFDSYVQELDNYLTDSAQLKRNDEQVSPRAGVVFQPNEFVSLYSSVSRSFQPSGENLSLATNNTELEPEFTTNYEGGIKANVPFWRLQGALAVFRLKRTNVKTTDPTDPSQLLSVGDKRTDGLEITASGSPMRAIDFIFGVFSSGRTD